MRRPVLVLFLLAPAVGEILTGATPLLVIFNPVTLFLVIPLYGAAAVLIRDIVRRRRLGWPSIILLGAAYGVLEEGLVVTSWFNPVWPALAVLHGQGWLLGMNWIWAIGFIIYHSVLSITIAILIAEAIFSSIAGEPWLGRKGTRRMAVLLTVISVVGFVVFGFLAFKTKGYAHPPASYLIAVAMAVGFYWWALHPPRLPARAGPEAKPPPGLWTLRLAGFGAAVAWLLAEDALPNLIHFALLSVIALVGLVVVAARVVGDWSSRPGWGPQHRFALASGVIGFWIILSPALALGTANFGLLLTAPLALVGVIVLTRRLGRPQPVLGT